MSRSAPRKVALLLLASPFVSAALSAQAATPSAAPTAAEWRADLDYLEREMPIRHRNLYHHTSPAAFHKDFAAIRALIPHGSTAEIVTAFMRLGTMVHDAHTGIGPDTPALAFENLPVAFYLYEDGLFIQSADSAHASLLGARVLRFGRLSADSAIAAAASVTDASNPMTVAAFVPFRLAHPDMLHALRITERADRTTLVLDRDGRRDTVTLQSLGRDSTGAPVIGGTWYWPGPRSGVPWLDSRDRSPEKSALWLEHPDSMGWSRYLGESRTLYVQCNQIGDPPQGSFDDFFARVLKRADSADVERLVLDLRNNGGGNNELLDAAIPYFVRSTIAQTRGRFFVITGRLTQSAAQNFVNRLELHTSAIFVGEPTGESPNMYGDGVRFSLPHSKMRVTLSSLWWQDMGPRDDREWTGPYLAARLTSADYRANRDPALETILAWQIDEPLEAALLNVSRDGDSAALTARYRAFTRDPLHRYTNVSGTMYSLSWALHRAAAQKSGADAERLRNAAIVALQLNANDHATSARAHSELASALAASGRAIEALREARAALAIDAHDPDARALVVAGGASHGG